MLFSGDLVFNGGTPFVVMGSVAGSLEALSGVMELEPDVIVPGHGSPGGTEMVSTCGAYLRWIQQGAEQAVAAGTDSAPSCPELGSREISPACSTPNASPGIFTAPLPSAGSSAR